MLNIEDVKPVVWLDYKVWLFHSQAVPSLVCPAIKVNEVMYLMPEPFELPAVNTDNPTDMITITPPCAHTGPGTIKVRLMSFEPREGQVTPLLMGCSNMDSMFNI